MQATNPSPGRKTNSGLMDPKHISLARRIETLEESLAKKKSRTRNTNIISVSLEPELADEAKRVARRLGLTVSGLIRALLRRQIISDTDLTLPIEKRKDSDLPKL